jgi:pre-mRNA-processing factor 19
VVSSKSGNIFEKRLIQAYISEHHKDPVTGDELEITDLIDVKSARIVTPRPPTLTSIPSLLTTFQNEWDALALESFTLRQQLNQTRQELATALYQHDAAVRVIARLTKERDEARDALSKVTVGAGASNGDAMQIDSQGLPEELAAKVDATQEKYGRLPPQCATTFKLTFIDFQRVVGSGRSHKNGQTRKRSRSLTLQLLLSLYTQARILSRWMRLVS